MATQAPTPALPRAAQPSWEHALCRVLQGSRLSNPDPVPQGHLVLAQDLPAPAGGKRYGTAVYADLPRLLEALPVAERCLYAMMTLCFGVDLYLDVENEAVPPGPDAFRAQVRLWESLSRFLRVHGWEPKGLLVLRSDTPSKSSFHWHVRLDRPWRNVGHVAAVVRAWYEHLPADLRLWVDHKVYDQNRCFRLMGCRKGGKRDGTLVPLTPNDLQPCLGVEEADTAAAHRLACDLDRLRPSSAADAVRWSACVRPDATPELLMDAPPEFQQAEKIKAGSKEQLWDVAGAIKRYAQDNAGWLTTPLLPPAMQPDQGLKRALGEKVSGGLTKATHFWGCKEYSSYHRPLNVVDVHRAMGARLGRPWPSPAFLNEAAGKDAARRPWIDLDHLGAACAAGGSRTEDVLDACVRACAELLTDASCLLVMSGVPQGLCPPAVSGGCHLRFYRSRVGFAEHTALLATVAQTLDKQFGAAVAGCVDPNCCQQLRTVWSDKACVNEVSWSLQPEGRVLRIHAAWKAGEWRAWDELGVMHDLGNASILSNGDEPGEATDRLVQSARHGQCRPWKAGKGGAGSAPKDIPVAAGGLLEDLVNGFLAPLGCQAKLSTAKFHSDDLVTLLSTPAHTCPAGAKHKNPWPVHVMVRLVARVAWLNCINTQTDANGHGPLKPRWTSGSVFRDLDEQRCSDLLVALFPGPQGGQFTQTETLAWAAVVAQLPPQVRQPGIARMAPRALVLVSAATTGPGLGFGFDWKIAESAQKEGTTSAPTDLLGVRFERQTVCWAGKQHKVSSLAFRDLALLGLLLLGQPGAPPPLSSPASRLFAVDLCQLLAAEPVVAERLCGLPTGAESALRVLRNCGVAVRTNRPCACQGGKLLLCFLVANEKSDEVVTACDACGARATDWIDSPQERDKAARNDGITELLLLFSGSSVYELANRTAKLVTALLSCAVVAAKRPRACPAR